MREGTFKALCTDRLGFLLDALNFSRKRIDCLLEPGEFLLPRAYRGFPLGEFLLHRQALVFEFLVLRIALGFILVCLFLPLLLNETKLGVAGERPCHDSPRCKRFHPYGCGRRMGNSQEHVLDNRRCRHRHEGDKTRSTLT